MTRPSEQQWERWADEGGLRVRLESVNHGGVRVTITGSSAGEVTATLSNFRVNQLPDWMANRELRTDHARAAVLDEANRKLEVAREALRKLQHRLALKPALFRSFLPNDVMWYLTPFAKEQMEGNLEFMRKDVDDALARLDAPKGEEARTR